MKEEKRQPKTKEELDALKKEVEELNEKLQKLDDKELAQVTGGFEPGSSAKIRLPTYATDY